MSDQESRRYVTHFETCLTSRRPVLLTFSGCYVDIRSAKRLRKERWVCTAGNRQRAPGPNKHLRQHDTWMYRIEWRADVPCGLAYSVERSNISGFAVSNLLMGIHNFLVFAEEISLVLCCRCLIFGQTVQQQLKEMAKAR